MPTEKRVPSLIVNTLTEAQYQALENPSDTEMWVTPYEESALPSQTGHSGEFLTTNGTTPSWAGLPDISGKANVSLDNLSSAGKSLAARLSMPSESHTDLTLGASGAIYTADYDGELCYTVSATNTNTAFVTVYQGTMVHQTVWFASGLTSLYPGGTIHIRAGQFGIVYGGVTGFSQLALYHKIGNEPS